MNSRNIKLYILVFALSLFARTNIPAQTNPSNFSGFKFDTETISESGKNAYETLLETKTFTLQHIGGSAEPYHATQELANLLKEKNAEKALQSLIRNAQPEGQIYGLLGLQVMKSKKFKADLKIFKNLLPALENETSEISSISGGCDSEVIRLKRTDIIKDLETGALAQTFSLLFS